MTLKDWENNGACPGFYGDRENRVTEWVLTWSSGKKLSLGSVWLVSQFHLLETDFSWNSVTRLLLSKGGKERGSSAFNSWRQRGTSVLISGLLWRFKCLTLWYQCRNSWFFSQHNKNPSTWNNNNKKKRRIIWNEITIVVPKTLLSSQHSFQSSITFTSRYTCPFQHQGFVTLFLCLKISPFPCHQPFKQCSMWPPTCNFHQQPRESLSSLQICNNHHTDILPEFLPTSFPCDGAYS